MKDNIDRVIDGLFEDVSSRDLMSLYRAVFMPFYTHRERQAARRRFEEALNDASIKDAVEFALDVKSLESGGAYGYEAPGVSAIRRLLIRLGRRDLEGLTTAWREVRGME